MLALPWLRLLGSYRGIQFPPDAGGVGFHATDTLWTAELFKGDPPFGVQPSAPGKTMSSTGPGHAGCGVCARAADGRLTSSRDQSDSGLGQRATLVMEVAIRCTALNCACDCFKPGKKYQRMCSACSHGWVSHALDKMGFRHIYNCHQVEVVQPSVAFDIASLMLYGTQAIPIRLKIPLDRLFSVLQHEEVLHVLHGFGWNYEDYARGYILQDATGAVLDRWTLASREEEQLILQQFLRFGETKSIAHQLLLQETCEKGDYSVQPPKTDSDIRKFIERTNRVVSSDLFKHNNFSPVTTSMSFSNPFSKSSIPYPPSSVSSTQSLSPSGGSPLNSSSPLAVSPLNKLQSMQPFDYRREKISPEPRSHDIPSALPLTQSTPVTSCTTSVPNLLSVTTALTNHVPSVTVTSDFSVTDGGSEEDSNTVMNLSQRTSHSLDSIYAAKKVKHLRKSTNPMKRKWNPLILSTMATNPTTGKKRVQCHVCFKTFCDKGALKIHFSAVHLREMHKCTVEGCNMMFSSRRSRNRHSANPNPKLHTPNCRRKLKPNDGRSAHFPVLPPTSLLNFNNNMLPSPTAPLLDSNTSKMSDQPRVNTPSLSSIPRLVSPSGNLPGTNYHNSEDCALSLTKKSRFDESIQGIHISNGLENIELAQKDESSFKNKGFHKRKSQNPIKCAVTSDDDMQYVSTDESSTDTFIDQVDDENGLLESKSDDYTSDFQYESKYDDFDKEDQTTEEEKKFDDRKILMDESRQNHELSANGNDEQETATDMTKKSTTEQNDISENPLRHLETLSLGAFTSMVSTTRNVISQHSLSSISGVSFHAPGLGLATPQRSNSPPRHNNSSPLEGPITSTNSVAHTVQTLTTADQDSNPNEQVPLISVYRDASMVGTIEVPVDKENPRRCIACGKIFQNHFGVKTHYQNVHLKLMHKCTVEGCNAAFPSKRSRDRHSANLNLHRKLLSTSSDKTSPFLDKNNLYPFHPSAFREDIFSRFYDPQALPLSFADLYHGRIPTCGPEGFLSNPAFVNHLGVGAALGAVPPFHPAFMAPVTTTNTSLSEGFVGLSGTSGRETPSSSLTTSPSPQPQTPKSNVQNHSSIRLDEELFPDPKGKFFCVFCQKTYHEAMMLREHYEKYHSEDLLICNVDGCGKAFLSKKAMNSHSKDDNVHMHSRDRPHAIS
ncbi:zinc finger protein basonuclin-2-like isoform X2 [Tachypleus tridentatus]|uniref:zinc finger protein basonuclin-2-like isoform X2 n=1 Tax=Tachypleus tridentatus TaxID=6853 RepID=UPI003FD4E919